MAISLKNNIASMASIRTLKRNNKVMDVSLRQMSSGQRFTSANQDAASLAISDKLKSQIHSRHQALRNTNDALGYVQTSQSALGEITNMVTRMRELSMQGANGIQGEFERGLVDKEIQQLKNEIQRVAKSTKFMDQNLLTGEEKPLEIFVGTRNAKSSTAIIDRSDLAQTLHALGIYDVTTVTQASSRNNLNRLDYALTELGRSQAKLGALSANFQSNANRLEDNNLNEKAGLSRIRDVDMASASAENIRAKLLVDTGTKVLKEANGSNAHLLKLLG